MPPSAHTRSQKEPRRAQTEGAQKGPRHHKNTGSRRASPIYIYGPIWAHLCGFPAARCFFPICKNHLKITKSFNISQAALSKIDNKTAAKTAGCIPFPATVRATDGRQVRRKVRHGSSSVGMPICSNASLGSCSRFKGIENGCDRRRSRLANGPRTKPYVPDWST